MFYQFNHPATVDYFKVETGKNFNFPSHIHECFELITVTSGEMCVNLGGENLLLKKGKAVLVFPNQVHSLSSSKSEHILCIFSPRIVSAFYSKISQKVPLDNVFDMPLGLIDTLKQIGENASVFAKKGFLYLLCDCFDKNRKYVPNKTGGKNLLGEIFLFIENNYKKECDLKKLSAEIGYDYSYLSRYFKDAVGISFNNYVNIYRLNNVCYLFENTKQSITTCAIESGYSSIRSFNRNFKKHFGFTPSQYALKISPCK